MMRSRFALLLVVSSLFLAGVSSAAILQVPVPYATIQDAVNAAGAGDTVQVAPGTFTESVTIPTSNVTLQGAGAGVTAIDSPTWYGVIVGSGATGVVIRGFTIRVPGGHGVLVWEGTQVAVADNTISDCGKSGIQCQDPGSVVTAERNTISGNGMGSSAGSGVIATSEARVEAYDNILTGNRWGINVWLGAQVIAARNQIVDSDETGINITTGSTLTATDNDIGNCLTGLNASSGAQIVATGNRIVDLQYRGMRASDSGTVLTATGNIIERCAEAHAVLVLGGATAELVGNTIAGSPSIGIQIKNPGPASLVSGNEVRDCDVGVRVSDGAEVTVTDNTITDCWHTGVNSYGAGTVTVLTVARNTIKGNGEAGVSLGSEVEAEVHDNIIDSNRHGVSAVGGAQVVATGNHIVDSQWHGMIASDSGTILTATGNTIERCAEGRGMWIRQGATGVLTGNAVRRSSSIGIQIQNPGPASSVSGNEVQDCDVGVRVSNGAEATVTDNTITDCWRTGVNSYGSGMVTVLTIAGNTIRGNGEAGVSLGSEVEAEVHDNIIDSNRHGVSAVAGAQVVATSNHIVDSQWHGMVASDSGTILTATGNTIERCIEDHAVWIITGARAELVGNTIAGSPSAGIAVKNAGTVGSASENQIRDCDIGVRVSDGAEATVTANTITDCEIFGISSYGVGTVLTITGNTIRGNGRHGVNLARGVIGVVTGNDIHDNIVDGIRCVGTSPTIEGNMIADNGAYGIENLVDFGEDADPATAGDDALAQPSITGNEITGNGAGGIYSLDTAPASITGNAFNGVGQPYSVWQGWYGLVQVTAFGAGLPGAEVSIYDSNLDPAADYGPYATDIDGYAPDTSDYHNATTWPIITQYLVDSAGVRHDYAPHTVTASHGGSSGSVEYPWDGLHKPGMGSDIGGRYQIAIIDLDTLPPQIFISSVSPDVLWPPNHKMVDINLHVTVTDDRDPDPTWWIDSVTSNEPVNGLDDGDTAPDWIIDGQSLQLRAERSGTGTGRIYTITIMAADSSGNTALETAEVTVPLNVD